MKNILNTMLGALSLAAALATAPGAALAGVITFDDLSGDYTQAIAPGYQGLNWENMGSIRSDAFPGSGYETGTVSPSNTAFNGNGGLAAISKAGAGTFDFIGAYFTSAWMDQELSFEGYLNGQLLYASETSFVIDTLAPAWVGLGWHGIDTLLIYNSSGTQWAMDNMALPEPSSAALFGAAAVGLLLARRRRAVAVN